MQLIFEHPNDSGSLETLLVTKAYESIWQEDDQKITDLFTQYTGLHFQQDEIKVKIHDGQSMSGMDGVPMRLNVRNDTLVKKRNALIFLLAYRLLSGNGMLAPDDADPLENDDIRVLLFQGDVIRDLYGEDDYSSWANMDPDERTEDHIKNLRYVLSMSKDERSAKIKDIIAAQSQS